MKYQKYIELALSMGATDAVEFTIDQIAFDPRTLLKCMYGCVDWGRSHTCPSRPGYPSMTELKDMFSRYAGGIIIHTHEKALSQRISFRAEGAAFADGYYFAFSLSDCCLCKACAATIDQPCRNVKMARPAFHSVGIDVFKTVRGLGLPLDTLKGSFDEQQNWYSAVFIE